MSALIWMAVTVNGLIGLTLAGFFYLKSSSNDVKRTFGKVVKAGWFLSLASLANSLLAAWLMVVVIGVIILLGPPVPFEIILTTDFSRYYGPCFLLSGIFILWKYFRPEAAYLFLPKFRKVRYNDPLDANRYKDSPPFQTEHLTFKSLKTKLTRGDKEKTKLRIYLLFGAVALLIPILFCALFIPATYLVLIPVYKYLTSKLDEKIDVSKRLDMVSLDELRAVDPRPPVVLLRSFADDLIRIDSIKVQTDKMNATKSTFEEIIADRIEDWGPLVAIGDPREPLPPLGAARAYFTHETWQQSATTYLRESRFILMILGLTPSVRWELRHVFSSGHASKFIVIMPPVSKADYARRLELISEVISESLGVPWKPQIADKDKLLAMAFDRENQPVLVVGPWAKELCYFDALLLMASVLNKNMA